MSKYLIAILLSAWSISLRAQVAEKLQQLGMENIQTVTEVNGNTTIAFEDNVYRGTYRGIGKAIEAAMEGMYGGNLQMVVLEHSIPQLCITLSDKVITEYKEKQITIGEVYRQMGISYDTDEAMEVLKKTHRTLNSSAGKVDIVVYPEVKLENSSFDRLYTYYVNLAPAVEMALWKGAELTAQVVFPVATNLKGQYKKIRPGVIALSQEFCFGKGFLGRVTAGNFTNNRMGAQAEMKYRTANGRLELEAMAGATVQSVLTDDEGWYISRKLRMNAALDGVSVTAGEATATTDENGQYSLTVKDKKTYTVSFAKEGYRTVSDASVEIANNATNRSLVTLNVTMSKEGVAVAVDPESDKVITEKGEGETEDAQTVLTIPAGAVSTATDVTLTPYLEAVATDVTPGSKEEAIPMTNIAISSSQDAALNQDVTLSVANASSSDYYFDEVEVYEKTNARAIGDWKKYADAAFDKATNSYIAAIKKGSSLNKDYSIRVKSEKNVSETKNDEILKEDSYSNAGNMSATTYDIPYTAKLGWEISASGLDEGALSLVKAAIAAQEGGSEGVYTVNKTFTAHVSGDYILYFSCKAKYVEKEYTFSIAGKKVTVKVKHYLGVEFVYTNQSSSMHGGGSIG